MELVPQKAGYSAALALAFYELKRDGESRDGYRRALELDPEWPRTARRLAAHYLHRYPIASAWMRKEALFYAKQAAQATEYKDLLMMDTLAEALAANGMPLGMQVKRTLLP